MFYYHHMDVFQLYYWSVLPWQVVGRLRAKNIAYGFMGMHLCAAPCINGAGIQRWNLLKVLVRYKLQLAKWFLQWTSVKKRIN